MRPQTQSLGFQQTSSGWNDESLVRRICFLHITGDRKSGGGGTWEEGKGAGDGGRRAAIDMPHAVPTPD